MDLSLSRIMGDSIMTSITICTLQSVEVKFRNSLKQTLECGNFSEQGHRHIAIFNIMLHYCLGGILPGRFGCMGDTLSILLYYYYCTAYIHLHSGDELQNTSDCRVMIVQKAPTIIFRRKISDSQSCYNGVYWAPFQGVLKLDSKALNI